jgi:hypothetical protein
MAVRMPPSVQASAEGGFDDHHIRLFPLEIFPLSSMYHPVSVVQEIPPILEPIRKLRPVFHLPIRLNGLLDRGNLQVARMEGLEIIPPAQACTDPVSATSVPARKHTT